MMKKLNFTLTVMVLSFFTAIQVNAQFVTPSASPGAELKTTVGLTDVAVEYSRPSVKGRTIFASDGLVPYGEIWRTGANTATKFSFSRDVMLGGKELKAGSYAVLSRPGAAEWGIMLYPYESGNFGSYVDKEPAAMFSVKSGKTGHQVETFTIDVNNVTNSGATIDIMWDNTVVRLPLAVHTDKQVAATFEKMMQGPSAGEYYAMGDYLYQSGGDMETALEYVRKATQGSNPGFWQVHREALILGELGRYDEAITTAKKSMEMAKQANNSDYVRLNENAVAKWEKMK